MKKFMTGAIPYNYVSFNTDVCISHCSFYVMKSGCIFISGFYSLELLSCVFEENSNNENYGCLGAKNLMSSILSKCHAKSCITYGSSSYNIGNFGETSISDQSEKNNTVGDCSFISCAPFEEHGVDSCRSALECSALKINLNRNNFSHNCAYWQSLTVKSFQSSKSECVVKFISFSKNTVYKNLVQSLRGNHFYKKLQFIDNRITDTNDPSFFLAQSSSVVELSECVFTHIKGLKLSAYGNSQITITQTWFDNEMIKDGSVTIKNDAPQTQPGSLELQNIGDLMREIHLMSQKKCNFKSPIALFFSLF